jgi:hypothetical protein
MFDAGGKIIEIAGVIFAVDRPHERAAYFRDLASVIAFFETRFNLRFRQAGKSNQNSGVGC